MVITVSSSAGRVMMVITISVVGPISGAPTLLVDAGPLRVADHVGVRVAVPRPSPDRDGRPLVWSSSLNQVVHLIRIADHVDVRVAVPCPPPDHAGRVMLGTTINSLALRR